MKKYPLRRLGVAHEPSDTKPSLSVCIEAVLERSDALLEDVLDGLQQTVARAGSDTQHDRSQPLRQAAVDRLKAQSGEAKAVFRVELRSAVYGGGTFSKPQISAVRFDDFQFLAEEQIDANIELAVTEQEVGRCVEAVLPALNALVSSLMGWASVQAHLNPLKPAVFVHALRKVFGQAVPDDEMRSAVMTPAAGLLGVALHALYKELVDWLKSHGVEPVAPYASANYPFGASMQAGAAVPRSLLTLDKLRRLLSGELDPRPLVAGNADFTHTVPASYVALEDMKLVEPMLKRLAQRAHRVDSDAGKSALQGARSTGEVLQGKALGKELGREVVHLMLENLLQDQRLLAGVREAVAGMKPLLQRLSSQDPRFFSDRKHPARLFLDRITHQSLAFNSGQDAGYLRFQAALDNAIMELAAGDVDANAFERVVRNLEDGWAREEHQHKLLAAEAARSLVHVEQRNMLAQRLAQEFAQRMTFKNAPDMVLAFLCGPWAQVVGEYQLRCAGGADDAEGYLALVDDLIWSVQPRLVRKSRARLVKLVPQMLLKIRQGLKLVNYPEEKILPFFDALIDVHEQAFDNAKYVAQRDAPDHAVAPAAAVGKLDDEPWVPEMGVRMPGFLTHVTVPESVSTESPELPDPTLQSAWNAGNLRAGSWVDLALGGQWVRAQLSWASPHRTLFMFMSSGCLAHSMSRRTMDRLRGLGLIRLVSDVHVIDSALDEVAREALRNDVKNAFDAPSRSEG
nr:DUF1631 family protein [uncultured Rhodoferax sp.]